MKRIGLIKIHMLLASFVFPVAFMFLVTGALYTWGVKGGYNETIYLVELQAPLVKDASLLEGIVRKELDERGVEHPSGGAKIKSGGVSFKLEWTGSKRDIVLEPTDQIDRAQLTIKETTWYRNLVQLHKAKGGESFKFYAAFLSAALFLILFTGFTLAVQMPKYKFQSLLSAALGLGVFAMFVLVS